MDFEIANLLVQDGISSGAIYGLMALGLVLIFNVTRVIFVPFGDLVALTGLTLGSLQLNQRPGTIWLLGVLIAIAFSVEVVSLMQRKQIRRLGRAFALWLALPLCPVIAALIATGGRPLPWLAQVAITVALVLPIGPLLYRIVFQPLAGAPILILLMISVALHFAISGLALLCFGPEGLRTVPFVFGDLDIFGLRLSSQMLIMIASTALLSTILLLFFTRTITGKALRATAMNRDGARLVGIRASRTGTTSFLLASVIAALAGVLISPTTTIYYDTGFMIGLKGFVAATVGGFVSYPLSLLGAILVGLVDSVSSFYASALKEAIVFASIIPLVLCRWLAIGQPEMLSDELEA